MSFLDRIEAVRMEEHEERMRNLRPVEIPDERERWGHGTDVHGARRIAAQMKAQQLTERARAIRRLRDAGVGVREICARLGITERKLRWAEEHYGAAE